VALVLLLGVVILLTVMSTSGSGPSAVAFSRRDVSAVRHSAPRSVRRPTYGRQLAPPDQRVSVHLKLPLTSGLLFNVRTGQVLWQRNQDRVLPIASLTKMMTALIVAARTRPHDQVRITPQAVHFSGSGVGLLPLGKRVDVLPLLYGLLLPSGNDAAIALAQHVSGTQNRFVALMNKRARKLGLRCTHYASPSGIVDQRNHSCVSDLAVLAHLMLRQPLLSRIVGSRSAIVHFPIKGGKLYLYNNNPLLVMHYPGADGVKTGYTTAAGTCLIATARRGRAWFGVVLLHSANIALQAETLLNAAFAKDGRSAQR
jgi:serine-type D-Ala-D-Ala carboxypeptidase (penicillin-binding protein 5/6)